MPHTKAYIKARFQSMSNAFWRSLPCKFILSKVSTTTAMHLDKVYVDLCSKSTKQTDRALACLQVLTLDTVGPIYEALNMIKLRLCPSITTLWQVRSI